MLNFQCLTTTLEWICPMNEMCGYFPVPARKLLQLRNPEKKHSRRDVIQGKEASKEDRVKTNVTLVNKFDHNVSNYFCCMPMHPIIINVVNVSFILGKILDPVYYDRGPGLLKSWTRLTKIVDPADQNPGPG